VNHPHLKESPQLIPLYTDFIKHFESKLNQLSFVHIILAISKAYRGTRSRSAVPPSTILRDLTEGSLAPRVLSHSCFLRRHTEPTEAIKFLEGIATRVSGAEGGLDAYLLVRSVIAQLKLQDPKNREETKELLESIQTGLEGVAGIDTSVYANYYKAQAIYHKVQSHKVPCQALMTYMLRIAF
jgi:hypothetical protein